jgi:hypothetical protein
MTGFYNFLKAIQTKLKESDFCNTVTYGDITRVDLQKRTIFPLSHFMVNNVSYTPDVLTYNVSIICMDLVDETKEPVLDLFIGNNNEHDVFNTQQDLIVSLLDDLNNGDLNDNLYQLSGTPNIEPFVDRFENLLAGWVVTFEVDIFNDRDCE